jgi:hypothetical protein
MICGLPPEDYNLTSGCHRNSKTVNFSPPASSPIEDAGISVQTGYFLVISGLPQAVSRDQRAATMASHIAEGKG